MRTTRFPLAMIVAISFAAAPAQADDLACRAAIAKAVGKFGSTAGKTISGCIREVFSDKRPTANCYNLDEADEKGAILKARERLQATIAKACSESDSVALAQYPSCPSPGHDVDDEGTTTGIDSFEELADCLIALNTVAIQRLHKDLFDISASRDLAHERSLGDPIPGVDVSLEQIPGGRAVSSCGGAIGKSGAKLWAAVVRTLASCQTDAEALATMPAGFAPCVGADPGSKISAAVTKMQAALEKKCAPLGLHGLATVRTCSTDAASLGSCVSETVLEAATSAAATSFEFTGACPASATITTRAGGGIEDGTGVRLTNTRLDVGWTGHSHNLDQATSTQRVALSCSSPDCEDCAVTVSCDGGNCRCSDDSSVACPTAFVAGGVCGAGTCIVFPEPPAPVNVGGVPMCLVRSIAQPMAGTADIGTGDWSLSTTRNTKIYTGISHEQPCPTCVAGFCDGGERDTQPCTAHGIQPDASGLSHDCPPSVATSIGSDLSITIDENALSNPVARPEFGISADAHGLKMTASETCEFGGDACFCGACSDDPSIACGSDALCADAGAGTCTDGGAEPRQPNSCNGLTCTATEPGSNEGTCAAGPVDAYCDGVLSASGEGIFPCSVDSDCDIYDFGGCTIERPRPCFLDEIRVAGMVGQNHAESVSLFCVAPGANPVVNGIIGLPGPGRLKRDIVRTEYCSDGVTEFVIGGSTCP